MLTEAAHTFGLCLFVYRVLPQFDGVRATLLMCTSCTIPAIFKLLLTKGDRGPLSVIIDILAVLMQCSMFFLITHYLTRDRGSLIEVVDIVHVVASVSLISFRYWENFVDRDIGAIPVQSFKMSLRLGRCKTYIFASLWKIGLTLAFAYILVPNMTPMTDLFNHIRNESLFLNDSRLELSPMDSMIPMELNTTVGPPVLTTGTTQLPGIESLDLENFNRRFRFRRQAENDTAAGDYYDYYGEYSDPSSDKATTPPPDDNDEESDDTADKDDDSKKKKVKKVKKVRKKTTPAAPDPKDDYFDYNQNLGTPDDGRRNERTRVAANANDRIALPPIRTPIDYYNYDYRPAEPSSRRSSREVDKVLFRFLPLIIQALSGAICYYFARVACKLCMQGFGFSLPLTLVTPATAAIFCYLCYLEGWGRLIIPDVEIGFWRCSESYRAETFHWQMGCALGLWWLSQLWINNHIWFPRSERLAKVERYTSIYSLLIMKTSNHSPSA